MDATEELMYRVRCLDKGATQQSNQIQSACSDLIHFMRALDMDRDPRINWVLSAAKADEIVSSCTFLRRLEHGLKAVVEGPIQRAEQYWTATSKPSWIAAMPADVSEEWFVDVEDAKFSPSTKPFWVGLFTSTAVNGARDMWYKYIHNSPEVSMFLPPRCRWKMNPRGDCIIREISSTKDCVQFVQAYPVQHCGLTYPDWKAAGKENDAIHMSLRAIAATQGICMQSNRTIVAPPFWSVESTLWLHWCFESVTEVDLPR